MSGQAGRLGEDIVARGGAREGQLGHGYGDVREGVRAEEVRGGRVVLRVTLALSPGNTPERTAELVLSVAVVVAS